MPEAVNPAAPAPEGSPAPASTDIDAALATAATDPSPLPTQPVPYLQSPEVVGRQAKELGDARKRIKELEDSIAASKTATPAPTGFQFDWSNPETSLERLLTEREAKVRAELLAEIAPQIEPVRNQMAAQQLVAESPLAATLLANPAVVERIKQIAADPNLASRYTADPLTNLRNVLFDVASERFGARTTAAKAIKAEPRPENAGVVSPAPAPVAAVAQAAPEPPKTMDEAYRRFGMQAAAVPGASKL